MTGVEDFFRNSFLDTESPFGDPSLDDLVQRNRNNLKQRPPEAIRQAEALVDWLLDGAIDPTTGKSIFTDEQIKPILEKSSRTRRLQEIRKLLDLSALTFTPTLTWKELLAIFAQDRLLHIFAGMRTGNSEYQEEGLVLVANSSGESTAVRDVTEAIVFCEMEDQVGHTAKVLLQENLARAGAESHRRAWPLRELVLTLFQDKYSTASFRFAARRIFEDLQDQKLIEWRRELEVYYKGQLALKNQDPPTTFERWLSSERKKTSN